MAALMEVCKGLDGPNLDLILHSPGGSAEATASLVRYLRSRFDHIRVFVPLAAMSAATMWALAGDEIVMGKHSQLGPIDPQLLTPQGGATPAKAIIDQFERAKKECADNPAVIGAWVPILQEYGPALVQQCETAEALAKSLVADWVARYMLAGTPDAAKKAQDIADYFGDHNEHKSHALGIGRDQAAERGVVVRHLEDDPQLQDKVLSVHHAAFHTFQGGAIKIAENHLGKGFYRVQQTITVPVPMLPGSPGPGGAMPGAPVVQPPPAE